MKVMLNDHEYSLVFQGKTIEATVCVSRRLKDALPFDIGCAIKNTEQEAQHRQAKLLDFAQSELDLIKNDKPWTAIKSVKGRLPLVNIVLIKEAVFLKKNELFG